jgi:hypothetical protein
VNGKKKPLPPEAQELIDRYKAEPPSEDDERPLTEQEMEDMAVAIFGVAQLDTGRNYDVLRESANAETRVAFPMEAFAELEYLLDDSTEEPTDLPAAVVLAWQAAHERFPSGTDDVSCEGEEEGEEWAFYCRGLELDHLLRVVRQAIPEGWKADFTPVPPNAYSGTAIAITRR